MGLILCFSSAGFSLRQRFKTNRLSVGMTWKWFWWGFVQPSSHRCAQSIRVPSASEVSAGSVGGSDRRWGSQLCWLGFREAAHCFHYPTAYCASSNKRQSITCHSTRVNGALNVLPQETAKLPFLKWTVLTVQFGEGKKPPAAQLLALTLFTYCCTQGIYIYSTTRNRCWVIEKLEPSIVLLSCHHREICFNLL